MEEQNKVNIEVVSVDDLIQDDHNFNKGTEQGQQLIERSFRECPPQLSSVRLLMFLIQELERNYEN